MLFDLGSSVTQEKIDLFFKDPFDYINNVRPLSYSSLKRFRVSPMHYLQYLFGEFNKTPAMVLGSAIDIMLLTPKEADKEIFVMPELNLRTNDGRAQKEAFLEQYKDKLVITDEQMETALKAVKAVYQDPDAMYYIERLVKTQVALSWTDNKTKLKSRGFIDGESNPDDENYFIMDLKSSYDGSDRKFLRQAYDLDYHLQCGGYTLGMKKQFFRFPDYINVTVETTAPFAVNVFRADSKYIEFGQKEYLNSLLAFKYAIDNNELFKTYSFHRFSTKYSRMEVPYYAKGVFG